MTTALNASHCAGFEVRSPTARTSTNTAKSAAKSRACALTLRATPSRPNDRVTATPSTAKSTTAATAAKSTTTASRASASLARTVSIHGACDRSMSASHTTGTSAAAAAVSAHGPGCSDVSGEPTKAPTPAMAVNHTRAPPLMKARRAARSGHTASAVSGAATSAITPCQRAIATSAGTRPGCRNCS